MMRRHRSRGLTLVEVGVLVVVLGLLVALVIPAFLVRSRSTAYRMTCGTNLCGLGKAMLIYANDYEDDLPRAGGPGVSWARRTASWSGRDRFEAYGIDSDGGVGGQASVSASLYLLMKYADVEPKGFVCATGEPKTKPFDPTRYHVRGKKLIDLWDFGPNPPRHVSYAYHQVYGPHKLTTESDPNTAVAADRNPWMDSPFAKASDFSKFMPDIAPFNGTHETARQGNATAHQGDGQNVLFLDSHVNFQKRAYCGVDDDNVYTSWDGDDKIRGKPAQFGSVPADPNDSLLVNDPAAADPGR